VFSVAIRLSSSASLRSEQLVLVVPCWAVLACYQKFGISRQNGRLRAPVLLPDIALFGCVR
jgi:hypothetical protein